MSNPLPFSEDSLNDTFFAESNLGHGSLPWVNGKPDQWSGETAKQAEQLSLSLKDENLINLLWRSAFSPCFRHTLLLLSQMILFRILDGRKASAIFDRHDHLIFSTSIALFQAWTCVTVTRNYGDLMESNLTTGFNKFFGSSTLAGCRS